MIRAVAVGVAHAVVAAIEKARLTDEERKYVFDCLHDDWCGHCGRELTTERPFCHCTNDD